MNRLFAIARIWLGCTVAWLILGTTLNVRTNDISSSLADKVYAHDRRHYSALLRDASDWPKHLASVGARNQPSRPKRRRALARLRFF